MDQWKILGKGEDMKDFSFSEAYKAGLRDGYQQALDDIKRRLLELSNIKSPENREKEGNK